MAATPTGAQVTRPRGARFIERIRGGWALPPRRAPLGPTVALTIAFAVASFAVATAVVVLAVESKPLPVDLPLEQRQSAETALYLAAFGVLLPVATLLVPRMADAIAAGPTAPAFSFLGAVLSGAVIGAIALGRLLPGNDAVNLLVLLAIWWLTAVASTRRARAPSAWSWLLGLGHLSGLAWGVSGALLLGSLLAFASPGSISVPALLACGGLAAAGFLVARRIAPAAFPRLSSGWGLAADVLAIGLILLAVPNLVIFEPEAAGDFLASFNASIIQFHQNFLLGTANQVLGGDAVLVDTSSQYGVAPIYALAAWFQVAPIGYGTLGFLDGVLYALFFAGGYCLLRIGGASRPLAVGALAVAIVVLLYNLVFPVGALPQHGPLRFGLPMIVVLAAAVEARWPRHSRACLGIALLAVGLSAIWAVETFAYTLATFAGTACFQAWSGTESGRPRWLARRLALAAAACLAAHLALAGLTLAFAGELPDWGVYLAHVDALLFGYFGQFTYDFSAWSAGLPVGVAYGASAVALVLLTARRPDIVDRERPALVATAAITSYGIVLFTYFVNRSSDDILPYVSFPALLAGTLWLSLLLRGSVGASRRARLGGLAFASALATLLVAIAWSSVGERFPRTPLALAAPGGDSLSDKLERLWDPPPIDPRAPAGEALLDRYMPGHGRVAVIVGSDLQTEILIRSERANQLPFSHPRQEFFAQLPDPATLDRAVAELEPGDRMLVEQTGLDVLAELRADPTRDPLADPVSRGDVAVTGASSELTPQQESILKRINERFRLEVVHRDDQGLVVVELEPRP